MASFADALPILRGHVERGSVEGVRALVEEHGARILEEAYDDDKNPRMIFKVAREGHVELLRVMIEEWRGCWEDARGAEGDSAPS